MLSYSACAAETPGPAGDDFAKVKAKLLELVAPKEADARGLVPRAEAYLKTQQPDGSWPDVEYKNANRANWLPFAHLSRLQEMARGYYASRLLGKPDGALRGGIVKGLDAWFARDPKSTNWWWNQIGAPTTMGNLFLLLGSDAEPAQKPKACAILKRSTWDRWTGQNLVWGVNIQITRGCLEESAETVTAGFERFYKEIRTGVQPQEGVMADWSFHQHGNVIYSGGYGQGFSSDCARLVYCASGTRFQASDEKLGILCAYLLDGQQWMVRGGCWDFGVVGREFCRRGKNARGLIAAAQLLAKLPTPRQGELNTFAARMEGKAPGLSGLSGNRSYWCSDFMVHQRPAFYASARMFSTRNDNTDSLTNDENKRSHFIADGAFCLMQTGAEYADIYPVWDWQKIPGITCEQREQMPPPAKCRAKGQTAFAGGVSDGTCGLAAFDFKREQLAARKAWFFFDDSVVCLGAGISCKSGLPVATCVNQCLLKGEVRSGEMGTDPNSRSVPISRRGALSWAWHDRVGYAFLGAPANAHFTHGPQKGRWSDIGVGSSEELSVPVFKLWIDHGANPDSAAYEYAVVPGVDEAAFQEWLTHKPIAVLRNGPELQAVQEKDSGVLGAAFYRPGRLETEPFVAVDQPCLVLCVKQKNSVRIAVANPENKALKVEVRVGLSLQGEGAEHPDAQSSRILFDLPGGPEAGRSVVKTFAVKSAVP